MRLFLRHASLHEKGAFGVLLDADRIPICLTLERTFTGGRTIIPDGTYECQRSRFHRGGYDTFEIIVPGHTRVLFHKANVETELEGCIGLGFQFGRLRGQPGILQSGLAFDHWWSLVRGEKRFDLDVA